IWPAILASFVFVVRMPVTDSRHSVIWVPGVLLSALSNPLGILLAPLFLVNAAWPNRPERKLDRTISAILALLIIVVIPCLYVVSGTLSTRLINLESLYSAVVFSFQHDFKLQVVLMFGSLAVLLIVFVIAAMSATRKHHDSSDLWISLALAYFGIGSLAFYLASPRFPHNVEIRGTFP